MLVFKVLEFRMKNSPDIRIYRGDGIDHLDYQGGDHLDVYTKRGDHHELGLHVTDLNTHVPDGWCIGGIEVEEHYGVWYTIDVISIDDVVYFLCEHEEYGDETANIIVDHEGNLILDDVWNGFDDLISHLGVDIDLPI